MGSYGLTVLATGAQRHNDERSDGAGGLGAGSERRQACISSETPAGLGIHAHTVHTDMSAKTMYSVTQKTQHCPPIACFKWLTCSMASYGHVSRTGLKDKKQEEIFCSGVSS